MISLSNFIKTIFSPGEWYFKTSSGVDQMLIRSGRKAICCSGAPVPRTLRDDRSEGIICSQPLL